MKKELDGNNRLYPTPTTIVGTIVESYADETLLKEGKVDIGRVKPLLFDMSSVQYWSIGQAVAKCWNIGKKMKPE